MGLSAWNALRARLAEQEKALTSHNTIEDTSTSPVVDGVEVETPKVTEEEVVKPKKRKTSK